MPIDNPNGIVAATQRESASIFGQVPVVGDTRERPKVAEPAQEPAPAEDPQFAESAVELEDQGQVEYEADDSDTSEIFLVTVQGEEIEVTLNELLHGYSRDADYRRKTQAVAEQRKQLEERSAQFEAERRQNLEMAQALHARLQEVESYLASGYQEPNWAELSRQLSPQEYNQARAVFEQQQKQLQAVYAQRSEVERIQAVEMERQMQLAKAKLPELIPDWGNEEVAGREAKAVYQFALDVGFSQEALENLYDPLAVKVLRDAWRYNELQKQKPNLVQRKGPKTAKAGSGMQTKTKREQQAEKALRGPVKAKDAADFFGNIKPLGARR